MMKALQWGGLNCGRWCTLIAWAEKHFGYRSHGSTFWTEIRGGATTWLTMVYIVPLNALILSGAADITGAHLDLGQVAVATAASAALMTFIMGFFGNVPMALAAGLGLNAVVAYQIAPQMGWPSAMGVIVLEGALVLLLVFTGVREAVFKMIPDSLKYGIAVGIGTFIAFIGLVDAGFVRRNPDMAGTPVPVGLGTGGRLIGWPTLVFIFGVLLLFILYARGVRGGIFIGIVLTTVFAMVINWLADVPPAFDAKGNYNPGGWGLNVPEIPDQIFAWPDFGLIGEVSITGVFDVGVLSAIVLIVTVALADFFDTMGTYTAVATEAKLIDNQGRLPRLRKVLGIDALAALVGGLFSSSSNTSYIESLNGVADGGRTGLANMSTAALFGLAMFAVPLVEIVPYEAATPALLLVGIIMLTQVKRISWHNPEEALPAGVAILFMPFSFSITVGIGAAIITYAVLRIANGKARQTSPLLFGFAALFVAYFAIEYVERGLGIS